MISKLMRYWRAKRKKRLLALTSPEMIYGIDHKGKFLKDTRIGSHTSIVGKENLSLADNVFIGQFNFIEASNGLTIEEGCQVTNYISILTHSSHNSIRYYGAEYRNNKDLKGYVTGEVHIGQYSFIGPHVTIMPNTKIGKGCIVAAYSLVKGDFPDFSIISGNPAEVIGSTKEKDADFLEDHPDLKEYYNNWAK